MQGNSFREVPLTWAGRVRTGNKQTFDYAKDYEVTCRFNEPLTREKIYKEVEKAKWPLSRVVGMVLRPGNLVDFTLKSKDSALIFAQALNNLDSIRSASAYADRVVEVRIDFIPPGFPTEPISAYLEQNHGEIIGTPIRISDRFNIQTGTRVFKMIRENLETNPIASYLYFGKYKFRVRYAGQQTTCGYCAEKDHLERECKKKENIIILTKNSKMERRLAKNPSESNEIEPSEQPTTLEEAKQSFEDDRRKDSTPEEREKKKMKPKEDQLPATQKNNVNKDSGKRPLSDDSSPNNTQKSRKKNSIDEHDDSPFGRDPEISSGSSSVDFSEFKVFADPCCHELIQKCTGKHFACACQKQFYKCKCGWKLLGVEKGAYRCDVCDDVVAICVGWGSFQIKKKGKLFQSENCHYQLTKELYRSTHF